MYGKDSESLKSYKTILSPIKGLTKMINREFITGIPARIKINFETIRKFRKQFKNYLNVYIDETFNRYPTRVILKDGTKINVNSYAHLTMIRLGFKFLDYNKDSDLTEFEANGKIIKMIGLRYGGDLSVFQNAYKLDVREKVIVDIGANIGDSAIHFVNSGAKRVIAIEPDPFTYNLLRKNVRINEMDSIVTPINAAVSYKNGYIKIPYLVENSIGKNVIESKSGVNVQLMTIREIVETYGVSKAVMKMDCEGCEYKALLNTNPEYLEAFDQFGLEYHYGEKLLVGLFSNLGYKVYADKPIKIYNKSSKPHLMNVGMLYAKK